MPAKQQCRPKGPAGEPWHGVSLGGWLLLEPGPAYPLFGQHLAPAAAGEEPEEARCEWEFMEVLHGSVGPVEAAEVIRRHRERHITKRDFERIRACGMNAVRLPFGHWVVTGPRPGEPYVGDGLMYIDRAVAWAEECGLQIALDLHGCPGGESGEAPCGRRQRPHGTWRWQQWDLEASLRVLEVVVRRYRSRACVTGIAVCNEPSNEVPLARLCRYYDRAMDVVRKNGMPASRVAVMLPVFQRPEDQFAKKWQSMTKGRHSNFCFDIHCYHCFENEFNGKSWAQQLRAVEENGEFFKKYPIVVGEWSLALGVCTWATRGGMSEDDVYTVFGRAQNKVMREASHGNFFWNWTERPESVDWNYQVAHARGMLTGPAPTLPQWDGRGEDPLERCVNPCDGDEAIRFGDRVCLRVFYGRYVDVHGSDVWAQWSDKGTWQEFVVCPGSARQRLRAPVRNGDLAQFRAHNRRFLTVDPRSRAVSAQKGRGGTASTLFVVHAAHSEELRHSSAVFLQSKLTRTMLDADDEADGLFARWVDRGDWQRFVVEKAPSKAVRREERAAAKRARSEDVPPTPKNRPRPAPAPELSSEEGEAADCASCSSLLGLLPSTKRRRRTTKSPALRRSPSLASLSTSAESLRRSPSTWSLGPSLATTTEESVRQRAAVEAA